METGYDKMEPSRKVSKMQRLIAYLKIYRKINPKEAWEKFGIYRLGARMHDLRHIYLWDIRTEIQETPLGEEFAVYHVNKFGTEPKKQPATKK